MEVGASLSTPRPVAFTQKCLPCLTSLCFALSICGSLRLTVLPFVVWAVLYQESLYYTAHSKEYHIFVQSIIDTNCDYKLYRHYTLTDNAMSEVVTCQSIPNNSIKTPCSPQFHIHQTRPSLQSRSSSTPSSTKPAAPTHPQ